MCRMQARLKAAAQEISLRILKQALVREIEHEMHVH